MNKDYRTVLDLLKPTINGKIPVSTDISAEDIKRIVTIAKKHDVANIVGFSLLKSVDGMPQDICEKLDDEVVISRVRYLKKDIEINSVKKLLDGAEIPYVFLKGAHIKNFYNEPWQRTSCDIDVLVNEKDVKRATELFTQKLGYKKHDRNYHDVSFFTPSNEHIELHFNILENIKKIDDLLGKAWDHAQLFQGCEYRFTPEFFMFHVIAHASYHFIAGGCGIRSVLDVKILKDKMRFDEGKLRELLAAAGLCRFYDELSALTDVWFNGAAETDISRKLTEYIFNGGVYGKTCERIKNARGDKNRFSYYLSRVFLPYKNMASAYPVLVKHKLLLPVFWVVRWFKLLNPKTRKKVKDEINTEKGISASEIRKRKDFMKELGLDQN